VNIGTSIGIALAPTDGVNPISEERRHRPLPRQGRRAAPIASSAAMTPVARRAMELDLHKALASDQFVVYYQAQVSLANNRVQVSGADPLAPSRPRPGLPTSSFRWPRRPAHHSDGKLVLERVPRAAGWPDGIKVGQPVARPFHGRNLVATVIGALPRRPCPFGRVGVPDRTAAGRPRWRPACVAGTRRAHLDG
jgi:hypothetical protein